MGSSPIGSTTKFKMIIVYIFLALVILMVLLVNDFFPFAWEITKGIFWDLPKALISFPAVKAKCDDIRFVPENTNWEFEAIRRQLKEDATNPLSSNNLHEEMKKKIEYEVSLAELMQPKISEIERNENIKLTDWRITDPKKSINSEGHIMASKVIVTFLAESNVSEPQSESPERKIDLKL